MTRHASDGDGLFSLMGPEAEEDQLHDLTIRQLARRMAHGGGSRREDSDVPAGYTYVGQFVAHDLTFDAGALGRRDDPVPERLLRGRTPSLDLDSLYGTGPHRDWAELYQDDGVRLRTGTTEGFRRRYPAMPGFDLPRGGGRARNAAARRRAVIADERNDDNLAIAQTHLAFLRFHNSVARRLRGTDDRFARARRRTTLHYQWMVWHDFLPKICDPAVLKDVLAHGRKVFEPDLEAGAPPTMPREFSVATFRIGHSMIRDNYVWSTRHVPLAVLFEYSGRGGDMRGHTALPSYMVADFRRLFDFRPLHRKELVRRVNVAKRIDTRLVSALAALPPATFDAERAPQKPLDANLAFRNLTRGREVGLATGQQMVSRLNECGVHVTPLDREQILEGTGGIDLRSLQPGQKDELVAHTPLWFYVLREAEVHGGRLHGVGAQIVAETFHRAIEGARRWSILREPEWRPTLGRVRGEFDMLDLLLRAYGDGLALPRLDLPERPRRR